MSLKMKPVKIAHLPSRMIGKRSVVIHPARGQVHELDEVGSFLWNAADGEASLEQICVQLQANFELHPGADVESDAREFFERLEGLGLVSCRS